MVKAKKKGPGRPAGTGNIKSAFVRDRICTQFRCSQGFDETWKEIKRVNPSYKSQADVLHRALEILAARELPSTYFWYGKIQ
jgi:hypothetical protein